MCQIAGQMTLRAVFELDDRFSATIGKIVSSTDTADKKLEAVTASTTAWKKELTALGEEKTGGGIGALNNSLLKTVSLLALAKKGVDLIGEGLRSAATMDLQRNTLISLLGSQDAGTALYDYGEAFAKESQLDQKNVMQTLVVASNYTRDAEELQRVLEMVERLYMKDANQGVDGAMFALKEMMEGSTMSARNRYGIMVSGEELRNAESFGKMLDIMDEGLNKVGATAGVVEANSGNLLVAWNRFTSNLSQEWGAVMDGASDKATEFVSALNGMQELGVFQQSMQALAGVAYQLAGGLVWVAGNLSWLLPLVEGAAIAIITYKTTMMLATGAAFAFEQAQNLMNLAIGTTALTAGAVMAPLTAVLAVVSLLVGAYIALTGAADNANRSIAAVGGEKPKSLEEYAKAYQDALTNSPAGELPVNIQNPDPISVKGEVKIEDQSLRYLYDLAEERRARQYAAPTIYLQNTFGDIRETADVDAFLDEILYRTENELAALPSGV